MDEQDELRGLKELHEAGGMSEADFEESKARLMQRPPAGMTEITTDYVEKETRQWATILHLSQFAGYLVPFADELLVETRASLCAFGTVTVPATCFQMLEVSMGQALPWTNRLAAAPVADGQRC